MIVQAHMAVVLGGVEVTLRHDNTRAPTTRKFETWGAALAAVNFATAWNGAPDPTTPTPGTPTVESERKAS